ncbi:hypothetical protein IID24_04560 [Patescibacteria group bacterium]|nr:hypothetical protein [Patescibacteria group bacterium]
MENFESVEQERNIPQQSSSKKKYLLIGAILIIVILIGLGSLLLTKDQYSTEANWKTYKSKEYGFSLDYPALWKLIEETEGQFILITPPEEKGGGFSITITFETNKQTLEDVVVIHEDFFIYFIEKIALENASYSRMDITILEKPAVRLDMKDMYTYGGLFTFDKSSPPQNERTEIGKYTRIIFESPNPEYGGIIEFASQNSASKEREIVTKILGSLRLK